MSQPGVTYGTRLRPSGVTMQWKMRKLLSIAFAVVVSGMVPVLAAMSLCTHMSCCSAQHAAVQFAQKNCCEVVHSTDTPVRAVRSIAIQQTSASTPVVERDEVAPHRDVIAFHEAASPPRDTQQRLSTLSLLRI